MRSSWRRAPTAAGEYSPYPLLASAIFSGIGMSPYALFNRIDRFPWIFHWNVFSYNHHSKHLFPKWAKAGFFGTEIFSPSRCGYQFKKRSLSLGSYLFDSMVSTTTWSAARALAHMLCADCAIPPDHRSIWKRLPPTQLVKSVLFGGNAYHLRFVKKSCLK